MPRLVKILFLGAMALFLSLSNVAQGPDLVEAWKVLDDAGIDDALRKDPSWLNRVSNWTDEGLEVASEGRILKEGSEVGRIVGDRLHVKYTGYGGDIVCDPDKTTTLLGKWQDPAGGGTKNILDSKLFKVGENKGGANVLSFDGSGMSEAQQWAVNSKWLNEAAQRGDVIRVVSDPMNLNNLFKKLDDVPINNLKTPKDLSEYLSTLTDNDIINNMSFFGREVKLLSEKQYVFDQVSKQFVK